MPVSEPRLSDERIEAAVEELRSARDFVRWGASCFNASHVYFGHGTDNAVDEALEIVLGALHLEPGVPDALLAASVVRDERLAIAGLIQRRINERKPVPYLTRRAWFAGLCFYVDERVLIPRSPIAEWIERGFSPWLDPDAVGRVLDIGTGSGCIAIACAHTFENARVDAIDVSTDALDVARINIEEHGLGERVDACESNVYANIDKTYDLIVSNPPYVDAAELSAMPAEYHHEPRVGLASGDDGLDCVREILRGAAKHLKPAGVLVVEVGASRAALEQAFPDHPFCWLDFTRGGENVFLLTADQLAELAR